jgi:hypothetical protein
VLDRAHHLAHKAPRRRDDALWSVGGGLPTRPFSCGVRTQLLLALANRSETVSFGGDF